MTELTIRLPDVLITQLQAEASERELSIEMVVQAALHQYLTEDVITKQAALETLRASMIDALRGDVRPAREVLDELRRELDDNGDES